MNGIKWNERYSVGIVRFDDHHKKLIDLLNELHAAMMAGKSREVLGKILDELVRYTKTHFSAEENIMQLYKYPGYPAHKTIHDTLTQQVLKFQGDFEAGSTSIGVEILGFLNKWLLDHIQKTDMSYSAFLREKGLS